ncbi:MAG: phosphotransferase [Deltaproteobacteria bacterium]|nr:phosphotransferase [Deltaproteobacteria bacterium]
MNADLKTAILAFLKEKGHAPEATAFQRLPGDGSQRIFWRITAFKPKGTFIAMSNPPAHQAASLENRAYFLIGEHLHKKGVPIPEIYWHDLEKGWFIMKDMGHTSLQDFVASGNDPIPLYHHVLHHLFRLQTEGADGFDPAWCCQTERYDQTVMLTYEADYFREAFLGRYLGLKNEVSGIGFSFRHLARTASRADCRFFLHRDFQSRNIMLSKGNIGFVDWQGGRLGPLGYDLASLIIDPYTRLSEEQKTEIQRQYLALIKAHEPSWVEPFERDYPYLAIQRNLQMLGAFSYLTLVMNKAYFETYIPDALKTLDRLLRQVHDPEISQLRELVTGLKSHKKILDISERGG